MTAAHRSWSTALAAGLTGAALAALAGIPAGALIGATLAVGAAAAAGLPVALPAQLRNVAFAAIGLSLGSGIDGTLLLEIGDWGSSLAILILSLIATILSGRLVLTKVFSLDAETATLASSPGTMSNAVAIAIEGRGDPTAVMFLQVLRLLVLVVAVPPLAIFLDAPDAEVGIVTHAMALPELVVLLAISLAVGLAGARAGIPAACLLTGMVVSAVAHATGLATGSAPGWVIFLAFAITGSTLGTRLSRVDRRQMARFAAAGIITVSVSFLLSLGFAALAAALTGLDFGQVWIAYAPGGVEAMAAIGLALGYDPAFVALHHFARILALVILVPLVMRMR
ncbi:AbrB family transcriptional regulator [Palleronia sp. LCG004]|uniref:AbrB family transcriptional regulator n=1 Tax=Palleronia sp. LCG004 TaxID=3079304 RepID=UPI0029427C57|nr:AbrB family transcriptional regulator [Palleronia sp. LCG004]WOI57961.1 AbrB family transcriptional regulator [Palleronia sp. LCG004]